MVSIKRHHPFNAVVRLFQDILTIACIALLFLSVPLTAQPIRFDNLSSEDGLPNVTITSIIKDRQGFLWFSTFNGITRYDGYSFKVFQQKGTDTSGIMGAIMYAMIEDKAGRFWIGSVGGGLNLFDPVTERFTHFRNDPNDTASISDNRIYSLYEDLAGNIWIGTMNGLDRYDPRNGKFVRVHPSIGETCEHRILQVLAIYEHPAFPGVLWIGTRGDGMIRYDAVQHSFQHIRFSDSKLTTPADDIVWFIHRQNENSDRLWIGTSWGLRSFDIIGQTSVTYRYSADDPASISANEVRSLMLDSSGIAWVGTSGGGLNRFDPAARAFTCYQHDLKDHRSICNNTVLSLFPDETGQLWAGTRDGISRFVDIKEQFQLFQNDPLNSNSLSSDFLYGIHEDKNGILWISSEQGLNRYDARNGTFTSYQHDPNDPSSLQTNAVRTIYEDRSENLWVGTIHGIIHLFSRTTGRSRSMKLTLNKSFTGAQEVRAFLEDRSGTFWVGTTEGLFTVDRKKWTYAPAAVGPIGGDTSRTYFISTMYEDSKGVLWISVRNEGIVRYDRQKNEIKIFSIASSDSLSINYNTVTHFFEDRSKDFWITTGNGQLKKFNREAETFTTHFNPDESANSIIYGALEDNAGQFWMGTNTGLYRFNPVTKRSRHFTVREGILITEFNSRSFCTSATGRMYFGGTSGLVAFYPDKIRDNTHVPSVHITTVKVFEKDMVSDTSVTYLKQLELPYNRNFLSFEFAALDFKDPGENSYAYMLDGEDGDWIFSRNRRYAAYSNLKPGTYVFKVKGSNNDGVWSTQEAALRITILPAYWQTWWFRTLFGVLIIGLIYLFSRREIGQLRREKAVRQEFSRMQIESHEEERKRLASELHDGLGQNLLVIGNELQNFLREKHGQHDELQSIAALVQDSVETVREISSNLHPHHLERLGFRAAIEAMVENLSHSTGIAVDCSFDERAIHLPKESEIHLYRIIQEALANVVRHASATKATVRVQKGQAATPEQDRPDGPGVFDVVISDNGCGFDPRGGGEGRSVERSLRHTRTVGLKSIHTDGGEQHETQSPLRTGGFGLASMRERARIINAQLTIESSPSSGTTIHLRLPLS